MVQGGVPPMRPDQALQPLSRAGTGPAPQTPVVVAREVLISGAGGGLFVYNATRTQLLESIAGAATIDPVTGTSVPAGTATYNTFGRVISLLSTTNDAFFQYANVGAAQGQLIASLSSSSGVDPVAGFAYNAGLYGLDAVGGNITTLGPVISFGEIPYTRNADIKPTIGSGATPPSIQLDAPEQTHASHLQLLMTGESPSAATPAQLIAGVVSGAATLTSATGSTIETQAGAATSSALSGVEPSLPAGSLGLDIRISGDTAARAVLTAGYTGAGGGVTAGNGTGASDTILLRTAAGQWVTSQLFAIEPATTTTAEVWHNVTGGVGYAAGFTDNGGGLPLVAYRLEPDGTVRFRGAFKLTANEAAFTTVFTLPAAYTPTAGILVFAVAVALTGGTANGASSLRITTAGAVQIDVASVTNDVWALDSVTFAVA